MIQKPCGQESFSFAARQSRPAHDGEKGSFEMETRIALIGIIVENMESTQQLNQLLHEYGAYIIGRMGIPYREKNVNIISVAMDAPQDVINALSGKVGRLNGITAKTVYSNYGGKTDA